MRVNCQLGSRRVDFFDFFDTSDSLSTNFVGIRADVAGWSSRRAQTLLTGRPDGKVLRSV
ncbi:hypothetical protein ABAC402_16585 [Asticcacaulis sp. AC402]|nr:hypothetical protein ABAC402_16585 [Asticcacaulis sp. AC402]